MGFWTLLAALTKSTAVLVEMLMAVLQFHSSSSRQPTRSDGLREVAGGCGFDIYIRTEEHRVDELTFSRSSSYDTNCGRG
jgi:hypothetical protein